MDLREEYKKEKGKWASVVCCDAEGNSYFTDDYVEWLEDRLVKNCSISDVVGQSEQLKCPNCELDYDKEEIEMFRGLCESCRDRAF